MDCYRLIMSTVSEDGVWVMPSFVSSKNLNCITPLFLSCNLVTLSEARKSEGARFHQELQADLRFLMKEP